MRLTYEEQQMLNGERGEAVQRAMDLLVRYGEALGAENLVNVSSVSSGLVMTLPNNPPEGADRYEALFCEFHLDSQTRVKVPDAVVGCCTILRPMDSSLWKVQGVSPDVHDFAEGLECFCSKRGISPTFTCAPYLVGYVPMLGEHCAWMESSAVPICNSVFGARTNTEGYESAGAAMMTGKTPNWGYHLKENRYGHYRVELEYEVESCVDWGLLGYHTGWIVQEKIPVFNGVKYPPNLRRMMYCAAAGASSGGVEMFHVVGHTPEARTLDDAFGGRKPLDTLVFGAKERREAYEHLQTAKSEDVDFVVLGCPHYSLDEILMVARMLDGKHISENCHLWIHTANAIKAMADRAGYTEIIEKAGAYLMVDCCPNTARVAPKGARVAACDSPKQAHHMFSILNIPSWYGSTEDCVNAALTGKWRGSLDG